MGRRESVQLQVEQRAAEFLAGSLDPGERILGTTICESRRRFWLSEAVLGAFATFARNRYHLVLTDRRILLVRLSRTRMVPRELELAEPYAGVRIERFRRGFLFARFTLRRVGDDATYPLRAARSVWKTTERLEAVARAVETAAGPVRAV